MRGFLAVVLVLAVTGAASRAADPPAGARAGQAAIEAAIAALPPTVQVHYTDAATDPASGAVTFAHLTVSADGKLLLAAERAVVTGAKGDGSADAPFAAARIELNGIGESDIAAGASADRVTADDLVIAPDGAAGGSGAPVAGVLRTVSASRIAIGNLHRPDGIAMAALVYEGIAHGRVARATITDAVADNGNVRVPTIEAVDVDVAGLLETVDAAADPAATPPLSGEPHPLLGRLALHDVDLIEPDATGKIDLVELADVRSLPRTTAPGDTDPTGKGVLVGDRRALARLARATAIGRIAFTGIAFRKRDDAGRASIAEIAMDGYAGGTVAAITVGATDFDSGPAGGAFGWTGIGLHGIAVVKMLDMLATEAGITMQMVSKGSLSRFANYRDLSMDGLHVRVRDKPPLTFERIAVTNSSDLVDGSVPLHSTVEIRRFNVPLALIGSTAEDVAEVRAFGRDTIAGDFTVASDWDNVSHELRVAPFRFALDELATLEVRLTLGGFDLPAFAGDVAKMATAAFGITFIEAEARFTDASLVDRAIAVYAHEQHVRPEEAKARLVARLEALKSPLASRPLLPRLLAGFLRKPGTLVATLKPDAPVPTASLFADKPDEAAQRLNLRVEVMPAR